MKLVDAITGLLFTQSIATFDAVLAKNCVKRLVPVSQTWNILGYLSGFRI